MNSREDDQFLRTTFRKPETIVEGSPTPDPLAHFLVAIAGVELGKRIEIGAAPLTIGRDARQALVFSADVEVSRLHAQVSLVNGEAVAEDLGSTNGTFVDAERITTPVPLREGSTLRVGRQLLRYERRSRSELAKAEELDRDLRKASKYALSLLPGPIEAGPVRAEWRFVPSAQLGGDAFGYYWLNPETFIVYLVDVSGHGVGAAMHSVAVMNLLRQRALPHVDFENPGEVLSSLNTRFPMDEHNGMFFTIWYGVYRTGSRRLSYASAGHHPAYLVPPDRSTASPLGMPALMIGVMPQTYEVLDTTVPPGSRLYLFSDGVFEVVTATQQRWALSDFLPFLTQPMLPDASEAARLHGIVTGAARPGPLEDDFSLVVVAFE